MHRAALTEAGIRLLPRLTSFKGFYLAGGTALALQIGHRRSIDFDLFSVQPLPGRLLATAKRIFTGSTIMVTYAGPEQLDLNVDSVKVTLLHYPYAPAEPFVKYEGLDLASIPEIAAMKAFAIGKRMSYKDYVDWYFLLAEKRVALSDVINLAQQKFGGDFNDRLFLGQLISIDDIEEVPIEFLRQPVNKRSIQSFLRQTVQSFKI